MGKITVIINDELENRLWNFIGATYGGRSYGKLKATVEDALELYLNKKECEVRYRKR